MKKYNKKAQFFLMAGIIIILVLYTLTINYNWAKESVELTDYAELRDTYNAEVPKVLNRAIFITTNHEDCKNSGSSGYANCPLPAITNFQTQFKQYSAHKDPNFGLVSIFKDPYTGDIIVKNLLAGSNSYIKIAPKDYKGEIKIVWSEAATSAGSINLNIGGQDFTTTTKAPLSYYGENLTKTNLGNIENFDVCIGENCQPLNMAKITTQDISSSQSGDTIEVDVCPSTKLSSRCNT